MLVAAWIEYKNGNGIHPETQHIIPLLTMSFYAWEVGVAENTEDPGDYTSTLNMWRIRTTLHNISMAGCLQTLAAMLVVGTVILA